MLRETRQGTVPAYANTCSKAAAGRSYDRELIEYLLALAISRRDTKAKARALIARFGGIGPLLAADAGTLRREGLSYGVVGALRSRKRARGAF